MAKISLIGQIAEIDREIRVRSGTTPRLVRSGVMKQEEAEMLMSRIQAVRATLRFCQEHETAIREYIAARKAGASSSAGATEERG